MPSDDEEINKGASTSKRRKISIDDASNVDKKQRRNSKLMSGTYDVSSGLKNTQSGVEFQKHTILYEILNAHQHAENYSVACEMAVAYKFDDLVIQLEKFGEIKMRLFQAKHFQNVTTKIQSKDLLSPKENEPFCIFKYFHSFVSIKNDNYMKDKLNSMQFIITTNRSMDIAICKQK